jgi:hypothetical protein
MSICRLFAAAFIAVAAVAQNAPKINSLSPEWIQRGNKAEVSIVGENLGTATNVIISGAPGVRGSIVPAALSPVAIESSGGGISSVVKGDGRSVRIEIEVASEAALTEREVRVVSPEGVSNPVALRVSPLREIVSSSAVDQQSAQKISLPAAITGTLSAAAQSHFYSFEAKKGDQIVAEVNAFRMGSKLDSSLAVFDKAGKELARNEDAVGLDSVLQFTVPEDGEYVLGLRDFRHLGGGDFRYRLTVGVLPYVSGTFPFGAQRGRTTELTLEGVNLDSKKLVIEVAADAPGGRQELRANAGRGLSNPFPLVVSDLPHMAENEPNSALDQADRIEPPVAINGLIGKAKDYDAFRFRAGAGQRLVFDVLAHQVGSRLDALLLLTDDTGKVIVRNDDSSGEDARIDYTFKAAGEYFIILEDLLGRGGENFGYRLAVETPPADFAVSIIGDTPSVRRGGRVPVRCEVIRMNGFEEAVRIMAEDLPGGVFVEPLVLASGVSHGYLIVNASESAALGSFPLRVKAQAVQGGQTITRTASAMGGDRPAQQAFLTVLDSAPFSIAAATLMATIEQNQVGSIDFVVERKPGFAGEVMVTAGGFSSGRDPITKSFELQPAKVNGAATAGALTLKTKVDSELGARHVFLRAEGPGGVVAYSPLIPLETTPIPFVLSTSLRRLIVTALPEGTASAAAEASFSAKAARRDGFEGAIELKLEGVPAGVTLSLTNIASKAGESAIKLVAAESAVPGTNTLTLTGIAQHKDRIHRFTAPSITLVVNAPEAEGKNETQLAKTE